MLQILVIYAPWGYGHLSGAISFLPDYNLSEHLGTVSLGFKDWLVVILVGSTVLMFGELKKFIWRKGARANG
jgi:hypothetical protein